MCGCGNFDTAEHFEGCLAEKAFKELEATIKKVRELADALAMNGTTERVADQIKALIKDNSP